MIAAAKTLIKRHWPILRLRTILLIVLLSVAAMPVAGAVFLRVYENTLVRQTEVELVSQGAALAAAAAALWPGRAPPAGPPDKARPGYYRPESTTIDLSASRALPARPPAARDAPPADPAALAVLPALRPVIDETTRVTLASVVVLDRNGVVVQGLGLGGGQKRLPEVAAALSGRTRTVLRRQSDYRPRYSFEWLSRASGIRLHHARPIVVNGRVEGVLLLSRSPRALFSGLYEDRGKFLIGLAGLILILVLLSGLVSRGITRPIVALSRASRDVAIGQGDIPETPRTAAVEIRQLYEDFRAMAEAIARRSRYLRDFAAAVSHEFKTPLAGIGGAVELLQDHGESMSPEDRARFLANISADNARLAQLVTRLLDLARADMARPGHDVAADVARTVHRVVDAQGGTRLAIETALPATLPPVAVPEEAIETVLTVLLENSRQAGAAHAVVSAEATAGAVVLAVSDDGPGVAGSDRERLFEPFFTSHRADGGTGLGLPIARSLLAASGGRISLAPSAGGARFEVVLPLAESPG
ncbi:MAG: HAMP domain-containing sensor histidine kinase [Caulobacter sp.]|nr:HAMP domain-containing sensor histidine kinase [Caulobacter sp.]